LGGRKGVESNKKEIKSDKKGTTTIMAATRGRELGLGKGVRGGERRQKLKRRFKNYIKNRGKKGKKARTGVLPSISSHKSRATEEEG